MRIIPAISVALVLASGVCAEEHARPVTNVTGQCVFWYGGIGYAFFRLPDDTGLRAGLIRGQRPEVDRIYEITGEVVTGEPTFRMDNVRVRYLGKEPFPSYVKTGVAELYLPPVKGNLLRPDYFGRPVEMTVQVVDVNRRRTQVQLQVADVGGHPPTLTASFPLGEGVAQDPNLKRGAIVRLRGVPSMTYTLAPDGSYASVEMLTLNIRGLYDVEVLNRAPWWTPEKIAVLVASLLFVVALLIVWIALLMKAVDAKKRALEEQERVRLARLVLAGDLHDTIEQQLATAKLFISGALAAGDLGVKSAAAARAVARILAQADVEVRDMVAYLRGAGRIVGDIKEEISMFAVRVSQSGAVRVRCRISALPSGLSASQRRDIVAIVREAATNAVKHGKARNIAIVCDAADGAFTLRIVNDGAPFGREIELGAASGHFGVAGMRERAARSSLEFSFVREDRWCGVKLEGRV